MRHNKKCQEQYLVDDMLVNANSWLVPLEVTCKTLEEDKTMGRSSFFFPKKRLTHPSRFWSSAVVDIVVSII